MLEHEFIRPSDSPYGAPMLFIPKKDGGLQFCIMQNIYPLPLREEMLHGLGGAKVFIKIDLKSAYWQMLVRE